MWKRLRNPFIALSLGLNIAFVAVWLANGLPDPIPPQRNSESVSGNLAVSSALHNEIGVSEDQWKQIEPHFRHFQKQAADQRRMISRLRGQLMELLASPDTSREMIKAKQEEILSAQRQMQDLVIAFLLMEKEILTPQQQKDLIEAIHRHCVGAGNCGSNGSGVGRILSNDGLTGSGESTSH